MFMVFRRKVLIMLLSGVAMSVTLMSAFLNFASQPVELNAKLIVVDAGHGGMDGGGVGVLQTLEKDLNLAVAKKLEQALVAKGYQVVMTRTEDVSLHDEDKQTVREQKNSDLKNRAAVANHQNAGLFLSIHMNKFESPEVKGGQVFYKSSDKIGEQYAKSIMSELRKLDTENHRVQKPLPNPNLTFRKLEVPGVLVECGFLSNEEDAKKLMDESYQDALVGAIVAGVQGVS
ncbi:MAG: N-acetylmuramoyl-L-alanine amidase [Clostridia bacterium]|nr:N-acetylmuramoyl-L-alanine amidase [Clostridia bacterium]